MIAPKNFHEAIILSKWLTAATYLGVFTIPFLLGFPQTLIGTLVNAFLVLSAVIIKDPKKVLPLVFLPSVGVLARGLVFGPFTFLIFYMLPFIWFSNAVLVWMTDRLYLKMGMNYLSSLLISSLVKSLALYLAAFGWVSLGLLPRVFLQTMGPIQFLTAILGGLLAYGVIKSLEKSSGSKLD